MAMHPAYCYHYHARDFHALQHEGEGVSPVKSVMRCGRSDGDLDFQPDCLFPLSVTGAVNIHLPLPYCLRLKCINWLQIDEVGLDRLVAQEQLPSLLLYRFEVCSLVLQQASNTMSCYTDS